MVLLSSVSDRAGELLRAKRLLGELGELHPEVAALLPYLSASVDEMRAALVIIGEEWRKERRVCDDRKIAASTRLSALTVAGDIVHRRLQALLEEPHEPIS